MQNESSLSLSGDQLDSLWLEVCQELIVLSSPLLVNAWAKTSRLQQIEDFADGKWLCTFACPSSFNALQFEKNLSPLVKNVLNQKLGRPIELKFVFNQIPAPSSYIPPQEPISAPTSVSIQVSSPPEAKPDFQNHPFSNSTPSLSSNLDLDSDTETVPPDNQTIFSTQKDSSSSSTFTASRSSSFHDGLFSSSVVKDTLISRAQTIAKGIGLNPDYNFNSFAVSGSNEMAHVAALSVANAPGVTYNPLFFYGGVGVGKTHLMQAIGNHILARSPETKIIYCTSEEFTNTIIRAIQSKKTYSFRDKFRACKVLLIDDIQFIGGKTAVQEEFFHTFNALVKQNSQIVITSDKPPYEIPLLEDRLRSRFAAGLNVDIQQPSFELRSAILLAKAKAKNLDLPIELAQIIASRIDSARKLEGIVMQLKSYTDLQHLPLTQELVTQVLGTQHQQERLSRRLQPGEVLSAVANHYRIKQAVIKGSKRQKDIIRARHVAMFLLKAELDLSYSEIGKIFSNRDHTSVLHAVQKINEDLKKDDVLAQEVAAIKTSVLGGNL